MKARNQINPPQRTPCFQLTSFIRNHLSETLNFDKKPLPSYHVLTTCTVRQNLFLNYLFITLPCNSTFRCKGRSCRTLWYTLTWNPNLYMYSYSIVSKPGIGFERRWRFLIWPLIRPITGVSHQIFEFLTDLSSYL